jgi:mRNA interferase RelE/StbE
LRKSQSGSAWKVTFSPAAERSLGKLDRTAQRDILQYLLRRIATPEDPRRFGKPLQGGFAGRWRYRVRDYRIVCKIEDREILILVLAIGHRRLIYE